jgi:glucose-1-phosphate cytidylyltransferase
MPSMKVAILAGGFGTRLAEETAVVPKPMVEVGGRPILWHIMKIYAAQGFSEFVVALGYRGDVIKRYFFEFQMLHGDLTIDLAARHVTPRAEPDCGWTIHLTETGLETKTGGRLLRLAPVLRQGTFMVTYGDGVADIDLAALLRFHRGHGRLATVTAVRPPARFGGLAFDADGMVEHFIEKPQIGEGWINGGFMVFEPAVLNYFKGDEAVLETDGLERLAADGQLMAYRHDRFWHCMDTLRDRRQLEQLWDSGQAPWKIWA